MEEKIPNRNAHFFKAGVGKIEKIKLAIAALLSGSASAFAPAQVGKASLDMNTFERKIVS